MPTDTAIAAILFQEGDAWVGHCVQYDIFAQGTTLDDARSRLEETIAVEIEFDQQRGVAPLSDIGPAPEWVAQRYNQATGRYTPLGKQTMPAWTMELALCA